MKKNRIIIICIALFIVLAGSFTAYHFIHSSQENTNGVVIDKDATEWKKELPNQGDQGIKIPGYGNLSVGAGEKDWNITLLNPEGNNCYFKYNITVGENSDPIYTSDYIEPGKAIKSFKVNKALKKGDYTIYMNIETYSMDGENTRMNGAALKQTCRLYRNNRYHSVYIDTIEYEYSKEENDYEKNYDSSLYNSRDRYDDDHSSFCSEYINWTY